MLNAQFFLCAVAEHYRNVLLPTFYVPFNREQLLTRPLYSPITDPKVFNLILLSSAAAAAILNYE